MEINALTTAQNEELQRLLMYGRALMKCVASRVKWRGSLPDPFEKIAKAFEWWIIDVFRSKLERRSPYEETLKEINDVDILTLCFKNDLGRKCVLKGHSVDTAYQGRWLDMLGQLFDKSLIENDITFMKVRFDKNPFIDPYLEPVGFAPSYFKSGDFEEFLTKRLKWTERCLAKIKQAECERRIQNPLYDLPKRARKLQVDLGDFMECRAVLKMPKDENAMNRIFSRADALAEEVSLVCGSRFGDELHA